MELLILGAMAFVLFALLGRSGARQQEAVVAGAHHVKSQLDQLYVEEHDYAAVEPAQFPEADVAYYDRAAAELEQIGFRRLVDLEDRTVSRAYPEQRTFIRVLVDEAGLTRVGLYHIRPRGGLAWLLGLFGRIPRELRVIELVTEVPTGRFLSTSNTKGLDRLFAPPEMRAEKLEPRASLAQVVERHRHRLAEQLRAHPEQMPQALVKYADLIASLQRGNRAVSRWRQQVGRLTRDELERMQGRPLGPVEELFLREVRGADGDKRDKGEDKGGGEQGQDP